MFCSTNDAARIYFFQTTFCCGQGSNPLQVEVCLQPLDSRRFTAWAAANTHTKHDLVNFGKLLLLFSNFSICIRNFFSNLIWNRGSSAPSAPKTDPTSYKSHLNDEHLAKQAELTISFQRNFRCWKALSVESEWLLSTPCSASVARYDKDGFILYHSVCWYLFP